MTLGRFCHFSTLHFAGINSSSGRSGYYVPLLTSRLKPLYVQEDFFAYCGQTHYSTSTYTTPTCHETFPSPSHTQPSPSLVATSMAAGGALAITSATSQKRSPPVHPPLDHLLASPSPGHSSEPSLSAVAALAIWLPRTKSPSSNSTRR